MNIDEELERERRSLGTGARVAIGALLLIGVPMVLLFAYGIYIAMFETAEDRFAAMLEDKPRLAKLVDPVKRVYPDEYQVLVQRLDDAKGTSLSEAELIPFFADFMAELWMRHREDMRRAGDAEVLAVLQGQRQVAAVATRNPTICKIQFHDIRFEDWNLAKDREAADALYGMSLAIANAAAAGRERPASREAPTVADQIALGNALRSRGLTDAHMNRLRTPNPADSELKANCDTLDKLFASVLSLQPRQIQRFGTQQMEEGGG